MAAAQQQQLRLPNLEAAGHAFTVIGTELPLMMNIPRIVDGQEILDRLDAMSRNMEALTRTVEGLSRNVGELTRTTRAIQRELRAELVHFPPVPRAQFLSP